VHLSQIRPWCDSEHRWYFYALDKNGAVCAFVALAMLSPAHGMQVKYSFDFPGAPNGVIEYIVTHAIQTAAKSGVKGLTFGAGATSQLTAGHNMHGTKVKMLEHTYEALAKQFHLVRKSEFRAKLGATEDPLYISYPTHGLGSKGIRAVLNFFED
jgi:aspartyl-tRNA synthetase